MKYTYIAAPLACALWLITRKQWQQAARFAATIAAMCVVALAIATAATRGTILTNLFLTHSDPFSWSVYLLRLTDVIARHRVLVALAAVLLIPDLLRRRISLPRALAGYGDSDGGERRQAGIELEPFPGVACGLVPVRRARLGEDVARTPARAGADNGRGRHRVAVHFPLARTQLPFDPYATVQDCDRVYAMVKQYPGDRVLSENVGALVLAGKPSGCQTRSCTANW